MRNLIRQSKNLAIFLCNFQRWVLALFSVNCTCVCYFLHKLIFSTVLEMLTSPIVAGLLNAVSVPSHQMFEINHDAVQLEGDSYHGNQQQLRTFSPESQLLNIYQCEKSESVNHFNHVQLFVTQWTVACQVPLSMGFSRQEYWSGQPFPSPGYPPIPGIELRSPALQVDSLSPVPPGKPKPLPVYHQSFVLLSICLQ